MAQSSPKIAYSWAEIFFQGIFTIGTWRSKRDIFSKAVKVNDTGVTTLLARKKVSNLSFISLTSCCLCLVCFRFSFVCVCALCNEILWGTNKKLMLTAAWTLYVFMFLFSYCMFSSVSSSSSLHHSLCLGVHILYRSSHYLSHLHPPSVITSVKSFPVSLFITFHHSLSSFIYPTHTFPYWFFFFSSLPPFILPLLWLLP